VSNDLGTADAVKTPQKKKRKPRDLSAVHARRKSVDPDRAEKKNRPTEFPRPLGKRGPKPTQIDWPTLDKLCHIQATLSDIAGWFDCSEDTIENIVLRDKGEKFSEYYCKKAAAGKISLRRAQFQLALEGKNPTMQIWLGKQLLKQSDKAEITGANGGPIQHSIVEQLKDVSLDEAQTRMHLAFEAIAAAKAREIQQN